MGFTFFFILFFLNENVMFLLFVIFSNDILLNSRWYGDVPRPSELRGPCLHVHLLRPDCHGPQLPEVPVVEEVPHHHSAGTPELLCFSSIVSVLY